MQLNNGYALVTGASGGIGREFALQLAAQGRALILVGRNVKALEDVKSSLTGARAADAQVIPCDLAKPGAAETLHKACADRGAVVDLLVNNAGWGLFGASVDLAPADLEAMVNLNISALTNLCSLFGRDMKARGHGGILNVGSFAGLNATPYFGSYAATKSYVLSYSLALRAELAGTGVAVTCLLPGYVRTAFDGNAGITSDAYLEFSHSNSLGADQVARIGLRAMARRRSWVIAGARNNLAAAFFGLLPRTAPPAIMKPFLDKLVQRKP